MQHRAAHINGVRLLIPETFGRSVSSTPWPAGRAPCADGRPAGRPGLSAGHACRRGGRTPATRARQGLRRARRPHRGTPQVALCLRGHAHPGAAPVEIAPAALSAIAPRCTTTASPPAPKPTTKVGRVIYTGSDYPCLAQTTLELGACAYVSKSSGPQVAIETVHAVMAGNTYVDAARPGRGERPSLVPTDLRRAYRPDRLGAGRESPGNRHRAAATRRSRPTSTTHCASSG